MPPPNAPETIDPTVGNHDLQQALGTLELLVSQANGNAENIRHEVGKRLFPHLFQTSEPPKFTSHPVGGGNDFEDQMSRPGKGGGQIWDDEVRDSTIAHVG